MDEKVKPTSEKRSPERHNYTTCRGSTTNMRSDNGKCYYILSSGDRQYCGQSRDAEVHLSDDVVNDRRVPFESASPQPQPEAALCVEHCGHGLEYMKDGVCIIPTGMDMCGHRCTFPAPVEAAAVAAGEEVPRLTEYKQIAEGLLMLDWILGYELTLEQMENLDRLRSRVAFLLERDASEDQP